MAEEPEGLTGLPLDTVVKGAIHLMARTMHQGPTPQGLISWTCAGVIASIIVPAVEMIAMNSLHFCVLGSVFWFQVFSPWSVFD